MAIEAFPHWTGRAAISEPRFISIASMVNESRTLRACALNSPATLIDHKSGAAVCVSLAGAARMRRAIDGVANGRNGERDAARRATARSTCRSSARAVARRKWWIIMPTCAAFALALAVVIVLSRPATPASPKCLLENQESYYTRPDKAGVEQAPALDPEGGAEPGRDDHCRRILRARRSPSSTSPTGRNSIRRRRPDPLLIVLSMLGLAGSTSAQAADGAHRRDVPVAPDRLSRIARRASCRSNSSVRIPSWPRAAPMSSRNCS